MILYMICLLPLAVVRNQVRSQRLNDLVIGTEHIFIDVVSCSCFHRYSSFSSFIKVLSFPRPFQSFVNQLSYFTHSIIQSFIQQVIIAYLFRSRHWEVGINKTDKVSVLTELTL